MQGIPQLNHYRARPQDALLEAVVGYSLLKTVLEYALESGGAAAVWTIARCEGAAPFCAAFPCGSVINHVRVILRCLSFSVRRLKPVRSRVASLYAASPCVSAVFLSTCV